MTIIRYKTIIKTVIQTKVYNTPIIKNIYNQSYNSSKRLVTKERNHEGQWNNKYPIKIYTLKNKEEKDEEKEKEKEKEENDKYNYKDYINRIMRNGGL